MIHWTSKEKHLLLFIVSLDLDKLEFLRCLFRISCRPTLLLMTVSHAKHLQSNYIFCKRYFVKNYCKYLLAKYGLFMGLYSVVYLCYKVTEIPENY